MQRTEKSKITDSHNSFVEHYAISSISEQTLQRFENIKTNIIHLGIDKKVISASSRLQVCDIGCGAGSQYALWEKDGHKAFGVDVNGPLIHVAKNRLSKQFADTRLCLGTANRLPYKDNVFDICLAPELLEHVQDWQGCLDEFSRILKPGGILFISTSNFLCPVQNEFNLPLYSWYPKKLKRIFEHKAVTSNPGIANFATFPAVNWFSYYHLKNQLLKRGFRVYNRFELTDFSKKPLLKKMAIQLFKTDALMKLIGNCITPSTIVAGIKE